LTHALVVNKKRYESAFTNCVVTSIRKKCYQLG